MERSGIRTDTDWTFTSSTMRLFASDLFRQFGIGFVAGTMIVGAATIDQWSDEISPPAQAAEVAQAPQPSAEFWSVSE